MKIHLFYISKSILWTILSVNLLILMIDIIEWKKINLVIESL